MVAALLLQGYLEVCHALCPNRPYQESRQRSLISYALELPLDLLIHRPWGVEAGDQYVEDTAAPGSERTGGLAFRHARV